MSPQDIERIIDAAGIYQTEASKLFGVTRTTYRGWLKGVEPKIQLMYDRATRITAVIERATKMQLFPLKPGTPRKERIVLINSIIKAASGN